MLQDHCCSGMAMSGVTQSPVFEAASGVISPSVEGKDVNVVLCFFSKCLQNVFFTASN